MAERVSATVRGMAELRRRAGTKCRVCGGPVLIQIRQGTDVCCTVCEKKEADK